MKKNMTIKKGGCLLAALLLLVLTFTGCGRGNGEGTTVVFTTGLRRNEVFRIDSASCTVPEIMVYLTNTQNQYESIYGSQIWDTDLNGITLEENVKDTVLARIAQVKSMTLLANSKGVTLTDTEQALAEQAAGGYFCSLSEREVELLGVTESTIAGMYEEYALAQKVYEQIIQDINPEISDDEARIITVQHILFRTYTLDGTGKRVSYTDTAKAAALTKAQEVLTLATDGNHDFETLIARYSEDTNATYSFGKGEMDAAFEEAAFNLGNQEISGIVESQSGYHIIKCVNTFNREETDLNKEKIVEQRKKEVFGQEYDAFVNGLTRILNEELWESITFLHDSEVVTADFFDVYNSYFTS